MANEFMNAPTCESNESVESKKSICSCRKEISRKDELINNLLMEIATKTDIKKEDWILLIHERKNKNFRQNKICFSR